jgi:uncharacterized protein YutE (UPF0331/DUF86 family)
MADNNIIKNRLLKLEEYLNDLQEYQDISFNEYKDNKVIRRFVERTLQLAIESCLDIGSHIIAEHRWGIPDTNRDIIKMLFDNGIIKGDIKNYIKMAQFRNVIIHDYAKLDDEIIFGILKRNLEDLRNYFKWIKEYISNP